MKQQINMNGVDIEVEINPPKLYGKIFTDWVEENYRGVLPKLTIDNTHDDIILWGNTPFRYEGWRVNWRYENEFNRGNSKTIRMNCYYNNDGSIKLISFGEGFLDRGDKSNIRTERGLKISMRNIKKKFLDNPIYRGKPSFYSEEEMWSSKYDD